MDSIFIMEALKASAWEEAKGKLRALVAILGSTPSDHQGYEEWAEVQQRVEAFITSAEDEGWFG